MPGRKPLEGEGWRLGVGDGVCGRERSVPDAYPGEAETRGSADQSDQLRARERGGRGPRFRSDSLRQPDDCTRPNTSSLLPCTHGGTQTVCWTWGALAASDSALIFVDQKRSRGTSLVVQWLRRPCAPNAGGQVRSWVRKRDPTAATKMEDHMCDH